MLPIRIALAQVNPLVGDLDGNCDLVMDWTRRAVQAEANVVIFPEMVITGYPVEDLALRDSFAEASRATVQQLATRLTEAGCAQIAVFLGYLDRDSVGPRNAAAVLYDGRVVATQFKHHLPNYGVFDERRYFHSGDRLEVVRVRGVDVGLVICEDLWQEGGPVAALAEAGVDLVVALNASPYERDKDDRRLSSVVRRAAEAGCPLAYVNMVGGQDELVFDGDSMVVSPDGEIMCRAERFIEQLPVVDLALPGRPRGGTGRLAGLEVHRIALSEQSAAPLATPAVSSVAQPIPDHAEMWSALTLGLRDYARKNGFRSAILGLSGGIDSAVVAALTVDALGADSVYGVSMPSVYSSEHSRGDAAETARRTGLNYLVHPIADMVSVFVNQLGLTGLAEENVQARCRALILMGLSNADGHLVLATGNKTELAVGYSTIYGDAAGGFAPIKDVSKTQVWDLARWRNAEAERLGQVAPIPVSSIEKPPSAELRPDQVDADSLPDYFLLDRVLDDYVESDLGPAELLAAGFDSELVSRVIRMVDRAEYKRRQYPPGTKITLKAFGRDRRLPITNGWHQHKLG